MIKIGRLMIHWLRWARRFSDLRHHMGLPLSFLTTHLHMSYHVHMRWYMFTRIFIFLPLTTVVGVCVWLDSRTVWDIGRSTENRLSDCCWWINLFRSVELESKSTGRKCVRWILRGTYNRPTKSFFLYLSQTSRGGVRWVQKHTGDHLGLWEIPFGAM